jgi:hypothetical protein
MRGQSARATSYPDSQQQHKQQSRRLTDGFAFVPRRAVFLDGNRWVVEPGSEAAVSLCPQPSVPQKGGRLVRQGKVRPTRRLFCGFATAGRLFRVEKGEAPTAFVSRPQSRARTADQLGTNGRVSDAPQTATRLHADSLTNLKFFEFSTAGHGNGEPGNGNNAKCVAYAWWVDRP